MFADLHTAVRKFDAETASRLMQQQGWHWARLGRAPEAWEIRSLLLEIGQEAIATLQTSADDEYTVSTGRFTAQAYRDRSDPNGATMHIVLEFAPIRHEAEV